jgi:hypothetical protein
MIKGGFQRLPLATNLIVPSAINVKSCVSK